MATATQDAVLGGAVDLAREAALELAEHPQDVGEHLGYTVDADRLVSHRFACTAKGYRGWVWTVTLSRVPRARRATVCEAVLLPGDDAVLAPAWVPWDERLRPGDVGAGDVLPFRADDPRLEPGFTPTGDPEVDDVAIGELALARNRVLSPVGIAEAAERWYRSKQGPASAGSVASAEPCMTCGFLVPLQGALGTVFGVCVNAWSPDDGKVVALEHGCGAHSETDVEPRPSEWPDVPVARELDVLPTAEVVGGAAGGAAADVAPAGVGGAAAGGDAAEPAVVVEATVEQVTVEVEVLAGQDDAGAAGDAGAAEDAGAQDAGTEDAVVADAAVDAPAEDEPRS
ncbi:DUF3027 domain-containing protein [Cellulomonas sp.]|uniref:DUF3027 domain-containing protein n=1 Tax=Cellulomonas sp. TaxID=40001 RepID=UPI002D6E3E56|nr:DUF3027 domain-containing protein [Cellulomonas sp.]HYQ75305.1 DUF3027 domain-containing protein [Cellulomonas sp.]